MLGTLFFDEARVNTAFRVRQTQPAAYATEQSPVSADRVARLHDGGGLSPAHRCAFSSRGEVALPSLRASLLWWLDADASVVQLLVVNDEQSAAEARAMQSRLLSIEIPTSQPGELVTCGVTRNYMGDNGVAVVWVLCKGRDAAGQHGAPQLIAGFAQVTVQRDVDTTGHSSLLMVPDEQIVECAPLPRVPAQAFAATDASASAGSGCVVAELPEASTARTTSIVVLTDGARLWRAELFGDGAVHVAAFTDDARRNALRACCEGNEEVRLLDTRTIAADLQRLATSAAAEVELSAPLEGASGETGSAAAASPGSAWFRRLLGSGSGGSNASRPGSATDGAAGERDGAALDAGVPSAVRRRLYAAVSAVQQSPHVALTRWNGQVEVYDVGSGVLQLTERYPIGILPRAVLRPLAAGAGTSPHGHSGRAGQREGAGQRLHAVPAGATAQWAMRSPVNHLVHVVTALADGGEGRACVWTSLPPLPPAAGLDGAVQGRAGEILAQHCTVSVAATTLSSTPLACAVTADGRRCVVVSDVGAEEDGHLLCTRSLGALSLRGAQAYVDGVATVVQVVDAVGDVQCGGLPRVGRLHGYLCQGARMQGVLARAESLMVVERGGQPCRLHALEDTRAADELARVTEGTVIGIDEDDVYGPAGGEGGDCGSGPRVSAVCCGGTVPSPHRVHFVPLSEAAADVTAPVPDKDAFALFWEGVNVAQACTHGSRFMADLLSDVLTGAAPVAQLASLPRFLSEAHLSGYTASLQRGDPVTKAAALAAVQLALSPVQRAARQMPVMASATGVPVYAYSRLYVTQSTMAKLLSRLTFLLTTYLGWQSTQSVAYAPSPSAWEEGSGLPADWVTQQIIAALEVLVAAYHAVPVAGPELVQLALLEGGTATQPTSDAVVAALLPALAVDGASGCEAAVMRTVAVVQVVNRLRRCGGPRAARACAAWVKQLVHRYPVLQHYQLLALLETAAAPTQTARVQACCERVGQALARESVPDVVELLFMEGLFLMDAASSGSGSAFRAVTLEEVATFLAAEPAAGPKLYAVGVVRRATGLGALSCAVGTAVSRCYLNAMLMACDAAAEKLERRAGAAAPFQQLRRAFAELQVDVLLSAALARVSTGDMSGCFHDVQAALDLMARHRTQAAHTEVVQLILSNVVEEACASEANMRALLRVTTLHAAQLEESLTSKWYNYIARLPTKSATAETERLRYRAIMGLHRFLMNRHSYAQCARLMSSLATLIRCSPLRRCAARGIAVSELAGLALHAARLIAPSVPMAESGPAAAVADVSPAATVAGSPLSLGYSWQPSSLSASPQPLDPSAPVASESALGSALWLTRADIPWLQRRLYQAQCERQLWRRGCTLDCTDLWVEGAPAAAYHAAVDKLVSALMQARLWPQAYRFARLSEVYDPCKVLVEWAVHLLQAARGSPREEREQDEAPASDRAAAWAELIGYCAELSNLENQFYAFARTVTSALAYAYEEVPAALLEAHRAADPYTAMSTLFNVALVLRRRVDEVARGHLVVDEESEHYNGATSSASSSSPSSRSSLSRSDGCDDEGEGRGEALVKGGEKGAVSVAGRQEALRRCVWRALSAAATIAVDSLQGNHGASAAGRGQSAERQARSPFTAGVMDPMAVCALELLEIPGYKTTLGFVPGAQEAVRTFLTVVGVPPA